MCIRFTVSKSFINGYAVVTDKMEGNILTYNFSDYLNCSNFSTSLNNTSMMVTKCPDDIPLTSLDETLKFEPDPDLAEFQEKSRFWVQRILVPLIMSIGVIGNIITIIIMTQRRMRSSTNCYLAALAIFDMSYLIFCFLLSLQHYPNIHSINYHWYWKIWPYILTLTDASSNSSVWLTVTFTVERYIAVCHPIKGKVLCTESRAQKMIVAVFVTCFLITLPTSFEWKIVEMTNLATNVTEIRADYSELGLNAVYVSVYYWMVSVMFIIIPFILLAVFNAFLIRSVHSSKSRRKTMTRRKETGEQSRQESKITVMLIAVVILFFLCQLPTAAILLYRSFHHVEHGSNEDLILRGLGNIFNFLMAINAAGNFVLYCLLSQKYRKTFLQIFCPCLKGRITTLHSVYQNTVYSTMDRGSPGSRRKNSIAPPISFCTGANIERKYNSAVLLPSGSKVDSSLIKRDSKFDFPNTAAVFSTSRFNQQIERDRKRVLKNFRCPWKRQKVAIEAESQEVSEKFIDMKEISQNPIRRDYEDRQMEIL